MRRLPYLSPLILLATACQDPGPTVPLDGPQFDAVAMEAVMLESTWVPVGKAVYFDKELSLHRNQSCATCHDPEFGFTGATPGINLRGSVYPGSVKYLSGDRKPPTAAYATLRLTEAPYAGLWPGEGFGPLPTGFPEGLDKMCRDATAGPRIEAPWEQPWRPRCRRHTGMWARRSLPSRIRRRSTPSPRSSMPTGLDWLS